LKIKSILKKIKHIGIAIEDILIVSFIGGIIGLSVIQIFMRLAFNSGLMWADELIKLFVLWATLIAAISASRQNKHLKIDLISKMINTKHALLLETFTGLVTCTICWVIAWNAFRYVGLTFDFDEKVLIDTSAWVVYSIVPVAFSLMGYRYLTISMHNLLKFLRAS
jgi:TRAP-type C4-dicarboxylate transport system permease small subunit|tara:strand:- start:5227 stop:5724 length:498 start_codon:yes stop_codon:yes gene_type:complete